MATWLAPWSLIILTCQAIPGPNDLFISPPEYSDRSVNPVWIVGSTQTVAWSTTTKLPYSVSLWQTHPAGKSAYNITTFYRTSSGAGTQSIDWVVDIINVDLNWSNSFWFLLHSDDIDISSRAINISRSSVSSIASTTSSTLLSSTTLPMMTISTTTSRASSTSSTSTPPTSTSAPGLAADIDRSGNSTTFTATADSATLKTALGVALGVGLPLVIFAAVLITCIVMRKKRKREDKMKYNQQMSGSYWHQNQAYNPHYASTNTSPMATKMAGQYHIAEIHGNQLPSEVSAHRDPVELDHGRPK